MARRIVQTVCCAIRGRSHAHSNNVISKEGVDATKRGILRGGKLQSGMAASVEGRDVTVIINVDRSMTPEDDKPRSARTPKSGRSDRAKPVSVVKKGVHLA